MNWVTYTPSWGGFSSGPTVTVAKYALAGKFCVVVVECTAGTSNDTILTMTLPFAAASTAYVAPIQFTNSGTLATTFGMAQTQASNVLNCFRDTAGATWTNSGTKYINHMTIVYEVA